MKKRAAATPHLAILVAMAGFLAGGAVAGEESRLPVPAVTIYPGDPIREEMLVDRAFAANFEGISSFVGAKYLLVGRSARRTLLPGQPIPTNAVEEPRLVTRGVPVKVIVEDEGLVIVAYGTPLQSGGVGALIRVRNVDTGVVVMGVVQADGSVRIGNG
jgi:flagellar basal body P-ring formation protein FlgA